MKFRFFKLILFIFTIFKKNSLKFQKILLTYSTEAIHLSSAANLSQSFDMEDMKILQSSLLWIFRPHLVVISIYQVQYAV